MRARLPFEMPGFEPFGRRRVGVWACSEFGRGVEGRPSACRQSLWPPQTTMRRYDESSEVASPKNVCTETVSEWILRCRGPRVSFARLADGHQSMALFAGKHVGGEDLRWAREQFVGFRHQRCRDLALEVCLPCVFAAERVEDPEGGRRRSRGVPIDGARLGLGERERAGQQGCDVLGPVGLASILATNAKGVLMTSPPGCSRRDSC